MVEGLNCQQIDELVEAARRASRRAYAPYSRFGVGAALLGEDGLIHVGCNVENVSYGLTICAERAAVGAAVSAGCRVFQALAVYAETGEKPATPCGACRQVLAEFNPSLPIVCASNAGEHRVMSLQSLLPDRFAFGPP